MNSEDGKNLDIFEWSQFWSDREEWHRFVHESFVKYVNETDYLKEHRDFVEANVWGLGERSFQWAWKLIVDRVGSDSDFFNFMEVGVHRGQITSLIGLLAHKRGKSAHVVGVSEYNGKAMGLEGDFLGDTLKIWSMFAGRKNRESKNKVYFSPVVGDSRENSTVERAKTFSLNGKFDIVYIDGAHDYESVKKDMANYLPMVKTGGFLVMDDSANRFRMPWGYFQGIDECSRAVDEVLPPFTSTNEWSFLTNVMHLRIFQRK